LVSLFLGDTAEGGVVCSKFLDVIDGSVCRDGELLRGAANLFCLEEQELRDLFRVVTVVSKCCKLGRLGSAAEDGELLVKEGCSRPRWPTRLPERDVFCVAPNFQSS
jgi:hypothetical protein